MRWFGCSLIAFLIARASFADFQGATHLLPYDEEFINYSKREDQSALARLKRMIESGETRLEHHPDFGYLPAICEELNVPLSSQMLVFSKTSFQRDRIDPRHPRGVYFGDNLYIGYVQGSPLLELTAVDKNLGAVFYTLSQEKMERPKLQRNDQCLECHASGKTLGVPGHLVRSLATDENGVVNLSDGVSPVTHRTPLADRWGGWYVTGLHGDQPHRGNLFGQEALERHKVQPLERGNLLELSRFFETNRYPVATSDIAALMVFEHQTHMQNFITRLGYEASIALQQYGHVRYLKHSVEAFLKYLLFAEEAPLTARIEGNANFQRAFEARGPKDSEGRSLRQLDLKNRLFKFPCSYLIQSEEFAALPEPLKAVLFARLWKILNGTDDAPWTKEFVHKDLRAIKTILIETMPDLPAYWRESEERHE